jgi:uncharacterized membrane protein
MPFFQDSLAVLAVLGLNVALSEWLSRLPLGRSLGTAFLAILVTALTANLGLIPAAAPPTPVYEGIFTYVAPLAIFYLMLGVNLGSLRRAGLPMLALFLLGTVGTLVGVAAAMALVSGKQSIGPLFYALGGMFTGTYIGGSINFNAVALHYGVSQQGTLFAAATAADNIISALWIAATIAIPQALNRFFPRKKRVAPTRTRTGTVETNDTATLDPLGTGLLMALGFGAIYGSGKLAALLPGVPPVLVLTTLALVLAQVPAVHRLRGANLLGLLCVYLFLAVVGAHCDVRALLADGQLAITLLLLVTALVGIHALITFGVGALLRQDWDLVGIASQANIGGAASAMACARSLRRPDLELPAILVGTLGNATGTYWGLLVAEWMKASGWFG